MALTKRQTLKGLATACSIGVAWKKPVVDTIVLPVHATTSEPTSTREPCTPNGSNGITGTCFTEVECIELGGTPNPSDFCDQFGNVCCTFTI